MKRLVCLFRPHAVAFTGRTLGALAEGYCVRCNKHVCCNREEGSYLPWDDTWDWIFLMEFR